MSRIRPETFDKTGPAEHLPIMVAPLVALLAVGLLTAILVASS